MGGYIIIFALSTGLPHLPAAGRATAAVGSFFFS